MAQKIIAVKNLKSQKLFIVVNERDGRIRLVAESGEVLQLPAHLFAPDRLEYSADEAREAFTVPQLQQYEKQLEKGAEEAEKAQKNLPYIAAKAAAVSPTRQRSASGSGSGSKRATPARVGGRITREWSAPRLTFYQNKIYDLAPRDVIRISIDGEGTFVITREDFDKNFNDVVVSAEFKSQGLFTYPQIPEKARRFFREE